MARNRKNREKASPSSNVDAIDIPEEEQWRIINETGILKNLKQVPRDQRPTRQEQSIQTTDEEDEGLSPFAEEIFNAVMLIIPMSFMLLLMDILVHYQYGRRPEYRDLGSRLLSGIPILSIFIFYTNRHKLDWRMQSAFFVLACAAGPRLAWLVNRGNWLVVMKQSPPLAVTWIYSVLQLNLLPALVSLVVVVTYGWYENLKLIP